MLSPSPSPFFLLALLQMWNIWSDTAYNVQGEMGAYYGLTLVCSNEAPVQV